MHPAEISRFLHLLCLQMRHQSLHRRPSKSQLDKPMLRCAFLHNVTRLTARTAANQSNSLFGPWMWLSSFVLPKVRLHLLCLRQTNPTHCSAHGCGYPVSSYLRCGYTCFAYACRSQTTCSGHRLRQNQAGPPEGTSTDVSTAKRQRPATQVVAT